MECTAKKKLSPLDNPETVVQALKDIMGGGVAPVGTEVLCAITRISVERTRLGHLHYCNFGEAQFTKRGEPQVPEGTVPFLRLEQDVPVEVGHMLGETPATGTHDFSVAKITVQPNAIFLNLLSP